MRLAGRLTERRLRIPCSYVLLSPQFTRRFASDSAGAGPNADLFPKKASTSASASTNSKPPFTKSYPTSAGSSQPAYSSNYSKPNSFSKPNNGSKSTFVSSHYHADPEKIKGYLARKNFPFQLSSGSKEVAVKICPFCHDAKGKAENFFKLYISLENGMYFCHRCDAKGSWFDFQKKLGDLGPDIESVSAISRPAPRAPADPVSNPGFTVISDKSSFTAASAQPSVFPEQWKLKKSIENLTKYPTVVKYLTGTEPQQRHLTMQTLNTYKVGASTFRFRDNETQNWVELDCVTFPWLERRPSLSDKDKKEAKGEKEVESKLTLIGSNRPSAPKSFPPPGPNDDPDFFITRMKYRPVKVKDFRIEPAGGEWGLFGWHLLTEKDDEVILTEGEIDAMSVYQATARVAISLPNGASSLPLEICEKLERFKRIYLWMDEDVKGQEGAEKFANKLGPRRTLIVHSHYRGESPVAHVKDANDALRAGMDLKRMLDEASVLPHKQILTFSELRDQVFLELSNPKEVAGLQSASVPSLNQILKGHRKGELTILTGATGVGKTTMISQLSIDYCTQGVNTLWGSFELQNITLVKKMLTQFAAKNLEKHIAEFNFFADKFAELPLYFLRFYGTTGIDEVIDAMEYATYVYDVEHIVLDNLQFMIGSQRGYDKFDAIDQSIERLRRFATDKQVHITLIIHPRKEDDGTLLNTSSVFGSAKATQEADNVLIVQSPFNKPYRFLQVVKNRFSGDVGLVAYRFDPDNQKYYELTKREMEALDKATAEKAAASYTVMSGEQKKAPFKVNYRFKPKTADGGS